MCDDYLLITFNEIRNNNMNNYDRQTETLSMSLHACKLHMKKTTETETNKKVK